MKRFEFPLQRVLDLRNTQLALEESRVRQQSAALADLDRQRAQAQASARSAEEDVRSSPTVEGQDLAALGEYRVRMQARERQIVQQRVEAEKKLAELQAAMTEARRRCRLLERLKERKKEEWQAARDKELEELASDAFLAGWGRESR